jgi:membrane fusion protein (multidrug efflux system)
MTKRMVIMLAVVGLLFGGIFGYKTFTGIMMKKYMSAGGIPPVTVSTIHATNEAWQPQFKAVGSLRAVRGVDLASEISGLVRSVHFKSGDEVKAGQLLVQLNADPDIAQLHALEAAADLAEITYERNKKQIEAQAISQSTLDSVSADLKSKQAQVTQQAAVVAKKTISAPFAGRLGISSVNPGQYVNSGEKIVTLQSLDSIFIDFSLPQQELSLVSRGQTAVVFIDAYPGKTFTGKITAINPKVDPGSRNVQVEAVIANPGRELLPGMYATLEVLYGAAQHYLTLPRTAVTFNPYGETVYLVEEKGTDKAGKKTLTVRQTFVTLGPARGDQVAVLSGVKEGDQVVTSGQLKIKNNSAVIINNQVQPLNDAAPKPVEQ